MSGASPLIERLLRDAEAEASRRIADATASGEARVRATQSAADAESVRVLSARRRALTLESRRATEEIERTSARAISDARRRAVHRVLDAMAEQLDALSRGPEGEGLLRGLLSETAPYVPAGALRVTTSPDAESIARERFPDARIICDAAMPFGAILGDDADRVRIDATLAGRLARAGAPLTIRIATALDRLPAVRPDGGEA
jgi:vacuolar-type H+-ATPase subunit E/Vma4